MSGTSVDPQGVAQTTGQDAAWRDLRERLVISLRPIGAPTSIGFYGLAAASLPVAGLQLGWVRAAENRQIATILIGFAFLAQIIAAVFSLLARDGLAGTAMTTLSLTWLVLGLVLFLSPPGSTSKGLGLFLLFSATAMALTSATAALSKLVPAAVFGTAALRFLATGIFELGGGVGWERTAGVVGLLLFALAIYAAFAGSLEDVQGKTVLPLGRRRKGKTAVTGSLMEQVKEITTEPGVREQL